MFSLGASNSSSPSGQAYRVRFDERKKSRKGTLKVSLRVASHSEFTITKESLVAGFGKLIGLAKEVQSGDSEFDRNFYVCSDSLHFTRNLLQNPELRKYVASLFSLGFSSLHHGGSELVASMPNVDRSTRGDTSLILSAVDALTGIATAVSQCRASGEDHLVSSSTKRTVAYSLSIAVFVLGIVLMSWGSNYYEPVSSWALFKGSLNVTLVLYLLSLGIMFFFVRGRSSSTKEFLTFLFAGLIGFPMCGYGASMILNGRNDPGEVRTYDLVITDRFTSKKKKNKTKYHVRYNSWDPSHGSLTRDVTEQVYSGVVPGRSIIRIKIKPGKLGYEWIESYEIK